MILRILSIIWKNDNNSNITTDNNNYNNDHNDDDHNCDHNSNNDVVDGDKTKTMSRHDANFVVIVGNRRLSLWQSVLQQVSTKLYDDNSQCSVMVIIQIQIQKAFIR